MASLIDLHAHTTASDGSLTPTELVELAKSIGLSAIAVTDHDTIDGISEAMEAGKNLGMEVVPGVELSTDFEGKVVHVLGYFVDPESKSLLENLARAKSWRENRNLKIVEKFNELGINLTFEEVAAKAGSDVVGRPHFAQVLMERKEVKTVQEAFDMYLDRKGKAYVSKFRFKPEESLGLIKKAGGLPVLAHPVDYKWSPLKLDDAVGKLCELGLAGLEILYTTHTPSLVQLYEDIAKRRGLLMTGGSDFHGKSKPKIKLGVGFGDLSIPGQWLDAMKARKASL